MALSTAAIFHGDAQFGCLFAEGVRHVKYCTLAQHIVISHLARVTIQLQKKY